MRPLEIWGGVECTYNRVGHRYFDQLDRTGHTRRDEDLERFADLGITAIRYPLLWERIAPESVESADWDWTDRRLERLQELGVQPIVGLVHHGSGPMRAPLTTPEFSDGLAEFAHAAARRYPWVRAWTPVNEPLTTARFCGLYGHWYPHGRDVGTLARALLMQCRGIVDAMAAIRSEIPGAALVQTEDGASISSTPRLRYQADYENERRWLSLDILCGRFGPSHRLWPDLASALGGEDVLAALVPQPCAPDVIGLNHYITSDRFLDERTEHYPTWSHGGNSRDSYADVEAARARAAPRSGGFLALLDAAWNRFGRPLALTEVHLGGAREAQLQWLDEAWRASQRARANGIDVRAVTVWSLLGAYDWNRLLVADRGFYESGVFDARSDVPRPTALASFIRHLADGRTYRHPVLESAPWWRRPEARTYGPPSSTVHAADRVRFTPRPILVLGGGTLGRAFARVCADRGLDHCLLRRPQVDIAEPAEVDAALDALEPWAVVNAAGYVRVDDAERDCERCQRENVDGPAVLAAACARRGTRLVTFSSDLVFDGQLQRPYVESDPISPLNVYGRTKADAERIVLDRCPGALVVRTSAFFGPWDTANFLVVVQRELAAERVFVAPSDEVVSPTYVPDLVHATLDLLIDGAGGVWHLANQGNVTWAELARRAATMAMLDVELIQGRPGVTLSRRAPRPTFSVLTSGHGTLLPELDDALERFTRERVLAPND